VRHGRIFSAIGLPPFLVYLVMIAEVLGGTALILGLWTRFVALR
jgi:putative oxidoreductase